MGFLDNTGLSYFYSKLKEKFIRTINSQGPDSSGNVAITNVATADNLTSPDAQASYDSFIYRTSGGNASLESGEAQLVYIEGNTNINGRVEESLIIEANNGITATYDMDIWRNNGFISSNNEYNFYYYKPTSSVATDIWEPENGSWKLFGRLPVGKKLDSYGIYVSNVILPSLQITAVGEMEAVIKPDDWESKVLASGTYNFIYIGSDWTLLGRTIDITTYGISILSGGPSNNDQIIVNYIKGTPNSILTAYYVAPQNGTIVNAKPTSFQATGFNQFDKNTMYLANAAIANDNHIISNTGTYLCYCYAKGGVTNGYVAYSASGKINNIAWHSDVPVIDDIVITENQSVTSTLSSILFDNDGYVVVEVNNEAGMDDLCVHPRWSGSMDEIYEAYVAPSVITIPQTSSVGSNLPIYTYGMPRVGSVADKLNLDAKTYTKNIERVINNPSNMNMVISYNVDYIYDDNYIYYVLTSPETYLLVSSVSPIYMVNDFGTEEFVGTTVPVYAQVLYGQNLRDKLRTDVITISEQNLSFLQKQQVAKNLDLLSLGSAPEIPSGANLNDYVTPGVYSVRSNSVAATISNIPSTYAGKLYVTNGTGGDKNPTDNWFYVQQTYKDYQGNTYERYSGNSNVGYFDWSSSDCQWHRPEERAFQSGSSYCKMPDGTLIQHGTTSSFSLSGGLLLSTITMSYNFINTNYTVMLTPGRNCLGYLTSPICEGNAGANIERTTNSFVISAKGTNSNISVSWMAIGRWK